MKTNEIAQFKQVSEQIASSGQPHEMAFKAIAQAGYDLVINLAMPDSERAIPEEGYIVTARKMAYAHIPVPFDAPEARHLATFIQLMQAFEGKKIWVHCVVNKRASAFLYQFLRLARGMPREQARKALIDGWEPEPVWQQLMDLENEDLEP